VLDGGFTLTDAGTGAPTCNFSIILEPSNYQGSECEGVARLAAALPV
jgi:hypothetical protein